jgi:NAD(P)-dependent dehydrogenase (short-subunit alcohol dehydrogenase family)
LDDFFSEVARWTEEVDILVNVAGGTLQRSFLSSDRNQDDEDIRLNFGYVMDSIRHTAPKMRRGGSIINFTTIEAHRGAASFATYAGAKAATTHLSRALAVELGPAGIRVNCVAPDTTPSVGNGAALPLEKYEAIGRLPPRAAELGLEMYIPLKSAPHMRDLANAVLFLASDLSNFVTGTTLHVDGGTWAASGFLDWPEGDGFLPVPMAGTLAKLVK